MFCSAREKKNKAAEKKIRTSSRIHISSGFYNFLLVRGRQRVRRERRLANQRTPLSPEERHLQEHVPKKNHIYPEF